MTLFYFGSNPAETIWTNPLKLFCRCGKIQNDPILPWQINPAKTIQRSTLKFADDPILPLWMNQAKTIWKHSLKL